MRLSGPENGESWRAVEDNIEGPTQNWEQAARVRPMLRSLKQLRRWPHCSLPRSDFLSLVGATSVAALLPLLMWLGSPLLWVLLPFISAALAGLWWALQQSIATGRSLRNFASGQRPPARARVPLQRQLSRYRAVSDV
jgi:hypothetical protein